jgi:hypothetical protein
VPPLLRAAASIVLGWCLSCASPFPAEPAPSAARPSPVPSAPPPAPKEEPAPEPEPEEEPVPVAEGPAPAPGSMVAVVEDGHAWIPQHCVVDDALPEEAALLPPWGGTALVLLSEGQVRSVKPGAPICYKGECGNNAIGVPIENGKGILLVADPAARLEPFELVEGEGAPPCAATDQELCLTWGNADLAIQVRGQGEPAEDEVMIFRKSDARIVARREGAWQPGPWSPVPFVGRTLAHPLGRELGPSQTMFWLHQDGLCCPSGSNAWTTTVDAEGRLVMGQSLKGPNGQDCGY